jgi:hypothetical protein
VGFSPQLVDFDGDSRTDVITGSYSPGHLYFFRRGADGAFLPGEKIKDKEGTEFAFVASVPFAADWNGDGLLDLVVGNINGEIHLIPNEGATKAPAFGSPQKLEADGKAINVPDGDSGPIVADWDGDKLADLLVGCGDGSVQFYRNVGTVKQPKLAAARTLIAASPEGKAWNGGLKENEWGIRVKICACDWNGDGKLDLLLGDRSSRQNSEAPTDSEKAEVEKARKRHEELAAKYSEVFDEALRAHAQEVQKESDPAKKQELRRRFEEKRAELQKQTKPLLAEMSRLSLVLRKAQPTQRAGFVFVFLRK